MSLLIVILAASLASIVNLMTKRNLDRTGTSRGYMVIYFLFSLLSVFIINPELPLTLFSFPMFLLGSITGVLLSISMILLPKALKYGPPGLTFAFQNASSIVPAFLLFIIFGAAFDFPMTSAMILGILCVLLGLLWASCPGIFTHLYRKAARFIKRTETPSSPIAPLEIGSIKKWSFYAFSTFFLQGIILSIFHWRTLLIDKPSESHPFIFQQFSLQEGLWFTPGLFATATFLNAKFFAIRDKRWFNLSELLHGAAGGFLNGVTTFLLLWASKIASLREMGIIFPLFAVSVIGFCSIWGQRIYKEKVNWLAIILCVLGVILGAS